MTQETLVSQNTLELIRKNQELRRQTSKFVKVLEGETRTFTFNAEAIESYVSERFNTLRFRYEVIEFGNTDPQYWEVSKTVSEQIDNLLVAGHTKLKVHRIGSDKRTVYVIKPAAED